MVQPLLVQTPSVGGCHVGCGLASTCSLGTTPPAQKRRPVRWVFFALKDDLGKALKDLHNL